MHRCFVPAKRAVVTSLKRFDANIDSRVVVADFLLNLSHFDLNTAQSIIDTSWLSVLCPPVLTRIDVV
eukprot:m.1257635 g.1257635  ORF g.1257635 m.1257635 type:complete len:68 (-) comp24715_c0_seq24:2999-3202(-)